MLLNGPLVCTGSACEPAYPLRFGRSKGADNSDAPKHCCPPTCDEKKVVPGLCSLRTPSALHSDICETVDGNH